MIQNYSEIKSLLDRIFALLEDESRRSKQIIGNLEKRVEELEEQLRNIQTMEYPAEKHTDTETAEDQDEILMSEEVMDTVVEVGDSFWDDEDDAESDTDFAWMFDIPGERVEDVRDAILFNDRINFIRELFMEDEEQYEFTMDRINETPSFVEVVSEMRAAFEWDENSDEVYRFYMAVRRRFE